MKLHTLLICLRPTRGFVEYVFDNSFTHDIIRIRRRDDCTESFRRVDLRRTSHVILLPSGRSRTDNRADNEMTDTLRESKSFIRTTSITSISRTSHCLTRMEQRVECFDTDTRFYWCESSKRRAYERMSLAFSPPSQTFGGMYSSRYGRSSWLVDMS